MPRLTAEVNDFETWCHSNDRLDLLQNWDIEKNLPNRPSDIARGSHTQVFWKCSRCGCEFQQSLRNITKSQAGCPQCAKRLRGLRRHITAARKNNFATNYPEICKEWHQKLNTLLPSEVSYNDNRQFWWTCSHCGSEWKSTIKNRVKGSRCPKCSAIDHTSFPERAVFYYVSKYFNDAILSDHHLGIELDIYIPSKKTAIEYDGERWHIDKEKDEKKNHLCAQNNIVLYRVRERNCWFWPMSSHLKLIPVTSGDNSSLANAIFNLLLELDVKTCFPVINIDKDKNEILGSYLNSKKHNSLAEKYPDLCAEWHPTKNHPLRADSIDYGSGIMCYWLCKKCGYEYKATPNSRTHKKSGCPACANLTVWPGHNDLQTKNPEILPLWDTERNSATHIYPHNFVPTTHKKVYWKCPKGHSWFASIDNVVRGSRCPFCKYDNHKKRVINLDTGEEFESAAAAGTHYGKPRNHHINECCNGTRKTALGYRWEYASNKH